MSSIAQSKPTSSLSDFPVETQAQATKIEDARSKNYQIPPLTKSTANLDQDEGYRISSAVRVLRCERDEDTVVGRKIGFTNKSIWPEYNVDQSNWSYMYRSSIIHLSSQNNTPPGSSLCDLSEFSNLEPKIEPEIVLGLKDLVTPNMTDEQILQSIAWIAHGFEMVVSIYPGWKFTAVDTTAAFALHGKLLLGPKSYLPLESTSPDELLRKLETFRIRLSRNGAIEDKGVGSNVLGSPVKALRHLSELLEKDETNLPLGANEMVTTGTLTRALSMNDGDRWQTEIDGLDVASLDVTFTMKK